MDTKSGNPNPSEGIVSRALREAAEKKKKEHDERVIEQARASGEITEQPVIHLSENEDVIPLEDKRTLEEQEKGLALTPSSKMASERLREKMEQERKDKTLPSTKVRGNLNTTQTDDVIYGNDERTAKEKGTEISTIKDNLKENGIVATEVPHPDEDYIDVEYEIKDAPEEKEKKKKEKAQKVPRYKPSVYKYPSAKDKDNEVIHKYKADPMKTAVDATKDAVRAMYEAGEDTASRYNIADQVSRVSSVPHYKYENLF